MNRSCYSTSPNPNNKNNYALKSPSPDKTRMNVLTPTKIKYLANSHSITGFDSYHTGPNPYASQTGPNGHRSEAQLSRKKQVPEEYITKHFNVNLKMSGGKSLNQSYVQELEKRIQVLNLENSHLVKKLQSQNNSKKNSYVIEKIKEQYEQKISTMRLMVEQEVKDAMGIIQDTCQALANQMNILHNRLEQMQMKVHQVKTRTIILMERQGLTNTKYEQQDNILQTTLKSSNNSISDIIGLSIPEEEQWEESKNYTMTITKLEEEIQKMKDIIQETEQAYRNQSQTLNKHIEELNRSIETKERQLRDKERQIGGKQKEIRQKNQFIKELQEKIGKSGRSSQHSHSSHKFNTEIKEELRMLYKNVNQMAKQLEESQNLYSQTILALEEKNEEIETMTREVMILRDKVVGQQQHRMLLEEKNKFLEGNIQILQREMKERKILLEQALANRALHEKQRLQGYMKKDGQFGQRSHQHLHGGLLEVTSRIDKLLQLQQERQKQLSHYSGNNSENRGNSSM